MQHDTTTARGVRKLEIGILIRIIIRDNCWKAPFVMNSLRCTNNLTKNTFTYITINRNLSIVFYQKHNHLANNNYLYIHNHTPRPIPTHTQENIIIYQTIAIYTYITTHPDLYPRTLKKTHTLTN